MLDSSFYVWAKIPSNVPPYNDWMIAVVDDKTLPIPFSTYEEAERARVLAEKQIDLALNATEDNEVPKEKIVFYTKVETRTVN